MTGDGKGEFRRAVSAGVMPGGDMVEVIVRFRPGWSLCQWWALYRLSRPPAWTAERPLLGLGSCGPRRSSEPAFQWEVVLSGVSDTVYAWLLVWLRQSPASLFRAFALECFPAGEEVSG